MQHTLFKIYIIILTILLCHLRMAGQNCNGALDIILSGSNSADTLSVDLETNGITCQSEITGNINLIVSGGNGGYQFDWSDDVMAENFRDSLSTGIYDVTITDSEGCETIVSAAIDLQSPSNTSLAFQSGCGNCILSNGNSDYFFNENNEYIASILDEEADQQDLGDTEVCLTIDNEPGTCNDQPYLQRTWSVNPSENNSSCVKLFFSQTEFEALTNELPDLPPPDPVFLINNNALCLTGFSGGLENCDDFVSAKTYAQTDAKPLEIILEDAQEGIWSVSVCLSEYATFYFHVCDLPLPLHLISFYGEVQSRSNYISWETDQEIGIDRFHLEVSRDAVKWKKLKSIPALNQLNNQYNFNHKNPGQGIFYYRLKIIENDGKESYGDIIALNRGLERSEQFLPALFTQGTHYQTNISHSDIHEFIFYNEAGRIAHREKVFLDKGFNKHYFDLERLAAGIYFVRVISTHNKILTTHKIIKAKD